MPKHRLWIAAILAIIFMGGTMDARAADKIATFAGGCFWCMEPEYSNIDGISKVVVGYTGGKTQDPTYEEVSSGTTGHIEAIEVTYDPAKVSYSKLLEIFWENIDPLDPSGQFCDKGTQYHAGIFYHDEEQQKLAEKSKAELGKKFDKPITAFIRKSSEFYPAEDYHQQYFIKSKVRYKMYRSGCGRDEKLESIKQSITK